MSCFLIKTHNFLLLYILPKLFHQLIDPYFILFLISFMCTIFFIFNSIFIVLQLFMSIITIMTMNLNILK